MSTAAAWVATAAGIVMVVVAVWDVFHTVWHPSGQGRLSGGVLSLVWRVCRRLGVRGRRLSGPAGMVMVIVTWAGMVLLGWALVYWPRLPESFSYGPGSPVLDPTFLDAVYLSAVTVATLGYGDIVPVSPVLRLVMPLESLLGFGLLTAAVSWVLQVYPALTRRRSLALRLATLQRTDTADNLDRMHPTTAASLLDGVTDAICATHLDYAQYAETYYFGDPSPETSLGATVGYARRLGRAAQMCGSVDARQAGASLTSAIRELARVLDEQYLRTGSDVDGVLAAFRKDQR